MTMIFQDVNDRAQSTITLKVQMSSLCCMDCDEGTVLWQGKVSSQTAAKMGKGAQPDKGLVLPAFPKKGHPKPTCMQVKIAEVSKIKSGQHNCYNVLLNELFSPIVVLSQRIRYSKEMVKCPGNDICPLILGLQMNLQLQVKSIAIEVLQTDFVPVNKSGFSAYTSSFAEELKTLVEMLVEDQKEPFSQIRQVEVMQQQGPVSNTDCPLAGEE
ncbi:hypothetical protein Anapl_07564 [Anas platyrhynchos]|uniref:Uncharacterized protein n=1 Tax=Anas platyrhynchos TaxID=8839 RepID=R0K6X5_ANAPL|nr:hypothetical protein Anapl_07564 [Anas platyrhynchos]